MHGNNIVVIKNINNPELYLIKEWSFEEEPSDKIVMYISVTPLLCIYNSASNVAIQQQYTKISISNEYQLPTAGN